MQPRLLGHIRALVYGQPWAVMPRVLRVIDELVALHANGGRLADYEIAARLDAAAAVNGARAGAQTGNGVAVIPLYGVIVPKAGLFADVSGATSVMGFQKAFRAAMADPEVGAIVLDVDSPGGQVDLVPELAAEIRAGRDTKPISAVANTTMASAAYWLSCQATEVIATPSAINVGAIGCYMVYEDESGAYEQAGVAPEVISAGKYKADDLGYGPLSTEARAAIQTRIDEMYGLFVADVAKGRKVKAADVRAGFGEGRVLTARQALEAGMIDRVATLEEVIDGQLRTLARRPATAQGAGYVTAFAPLTGGAEQEPLLEPIIHAQLAENAAAGADQSGELETIMAELETVPSPTAATAFELDLRRRRVAV